MPPSLYPLIFHPIFKERVWGGRSLEKLYHKAMPPEVPIGESWEISDRPGDTSLIASGGPFAGKDLRWLMENRERDLLGDAKSANGRFPLLIKILDAQEKLSLQVHPPTEKAAELAGEPKTEAWYIAHAAPGAELYVGLKRGVTRQDFKKKIQTGGVAECFHRIPVRAGDAMFLPSGRVHAIGGGIVIFEIQQNSDTTYRVFDWDRVGLDGKSRELHVEQSLASIDFNDFEPTLVSEEFTTAQEIRRRCLVNNPLFDIEEFRSAGSDVITTTGGRPRVVAVVQGKLMIRNITVGGNSIGRPLSPGEFCLLPASIDASLSANPKTTFLIATAG